MIRIYSFGEYLMNDVACSVLYEMNNY